MSPAARENVGGVKSSSGLVFRFFLYSFASIMKGIFLTIVLALVYIALLTFTFEYFINRPSDTLLTLAGLGLFLAFTFLFIRILLKKFKNR